MTGETRVNSVTCTAMPDCLRVAGTVSGGFKRDTRHCSDHGSDPSSVANLFFVGVKMLSSRSWLLQPSYHCFRGLICPVFVARSRCSSQRWHGAEAAAQADEGQIEASWPGIRGALGR